MIGPTVIGRPLRPKRRGCRAFGDALVQGVLIGRRGVVACEFLCHCPLPPADPGRFLCTIRYIMHAWTRAIKGFSIKI
jgi:hypothetical protein